MRQNHAIRQIAVRLGGHARAAQLLVVLFGRMRRVALQIGQLVLGLIEAAQQEYRNDDDDYGGGRRTGQQEWQNVREAVAAKVLGQPRGANVSGAADLGLGFVADAGTDHHHAQATRQIGPEAAVVDGARHIGGRFVLGLVDAEGDLVAVDANRGECVLHLQHFGDGGQDAFALVPGVHSVRDKSARP